MFVATIPALANTPTVPIAPGVSLPLVSLGTGSGQHADVASAVALWLQLGGRAIDTAYLYQDESAVATGVAKSGVCAAEVFITTKIMCDSYDKVGAEIAFNLARLGAVPDLTLIHFPGDKGSHFPCPTGGSIADTWRALEDAKAAGKTKAIGVSNFDSADLRTLKQSARLWPPSLNQASMSVGFHDDDTIATCDRERIVYMAYSPLCGGSNGSSCRHGSVFAIPEVTSIAKAHQVSAAQVALKWIVQQGRPLATAVARADYVKEDLDLWSWGNLTREEMAALSAVKVQPV